MNRPIAIVLAVLLAGTAAIAFFEYWEAQSLDTKMAGLNQELTAANAARDLAEKNARTAADELAKAREEAAQLTQALADARKAKPGGAAPQSPATADAGNPAPSADAKPASPMAGFAQMFKTEEGRKMMKSQMGMASRMMYGGLAKALGLSKENGDLLMGILSDRQMAMSEQGFAFLDGGPLDEKKIAELTASNNKTRSEYDTKIKAIIGEEKFAQMKDYESTVGDRMMLSMSQSQFSAAPLGDDQKEALLKIMSDTRKSGPIPVFDPTGQDVGRGIRALQDEGSMDRHLAQETAYQQKVLQAATSTLNPDQISALQKGFESALQMQKFQIEMSKQMFGKPANAAPAPAPAK